MRRRTFLAAFLSACALAGPAFAQATVDRMVRRLERDGYTRITMRRTLLGRVRIVGTNSQGSREIVINPTTGTVLRDYTEVKRDQSDEDNSGKGSGNNGSGNGNDDDDDRDDDDDDDRDDDDRDDDDRDDDDDDDRDDDDRDDDDDDDRDDDNSGPGGGNDDDDDD